MQIGTVFRLWFRGRTWRFKIHLWMNIVPFRKSYFCSNKLDVQETNRRVTQFNRIRNHLFGHWIEIRRASCSRVVGSDSFCFWKRDSDFWRNGATCWHWKKSKISREDQRAEECWFRSLKCPIFASRSLVVCVRRQWSRDQDDHWRKKSYSGTRFQNPQSCSCLVVRSN